MCLGAFVARVMGLGISRLHRLSAYPPEALTIARMPTRTAGESWSQAATNLARSGGSALQSAIRVPESAVSVEKNGGASNPVLPTSRLRRTNSRIR